MLENLYIMLMLVGIGLTIYAIKNESIVYNLMSVVIWLVLMAESLNIQNFYYAYVANNTTITNITTGYAQKSEFGLSALCLMFVFINLIYALILQFDWRRKLP